MSGRQRRPQQRRRHHNRPVIVIKDKQRQLTREASAWWEDRSVSPSEEIWIDTAEAGLACAIELMRGVERARTDGELPLSVRMGMHHGEALARGDDLVGQTINIGARVADLAGPGELLVSDAVLAGCGDLGPNTRLEAVGPVFVKGVQEAVWLHRVAKAA